MGEETGETQLCQGRVGERGARNLRRQAEEDHGGTQERSWPIPAA